MNHRIVVGVDGSDEAITALEWALDEGLLRGAEVQVIHAFHLFPDLSELAALTEQPDMVAQADELLRKAVEPALATRPGVKVTTEAVQGPPARTPARRRLRRRPPGRRLPGTGRVRRTAARIGEPAVRPPRPLSRRGRALERPGLRPAP